MQSPLILRTRALAKINLSLRVLGRRSDGYHDLISRVAFASTGDDLALVPAAYASLTVSGPMADHSGPIADNLVLKAASAAQAAIPALKTGHFHLVKRLPVASGIGGGSSDAAAALRLLARLNGISRTDPRLMIIARSIGADVPVCLAAKGRMMSGVGENLGPVLPALKVFAVLVNPGAAVPTPHVFRQLGLQPGDTCASADTCTSDWRAGSNDLQAPAIRVAPVIADVLAALSAMPGAELVRMSGSGATCFALFPDCITSSHAARALRALHPNWWIKATLIR
jgi:4-diphosphocytidyl-2-C-methyl-D-erythritol kinase